MSFKCSSFEKYRFEMCYDILPSNCYYYLYTFVKKFVQTKMNLDSTKGNVCNRACREVLRGAVLVTTFGDRVVYRAVLLRPR